MNLLQFHIQTDDDKIVEAIREAERHTSSEIRVYIASAKHPHAYAAAVEQFHKLNMTATRERNAVLIFIAPRSQTFAIVGDSGVHQRCGDDFWQQVASEMNRAFADGNPTQAIVKGIHRITKILAEHFPRRADDQNELPDAPLHGR